MLSLVYFEHFCSLFVLNRKCKFSLVFKPIFFIYFSLTCEIFLIYFSMGKLNFLQKSENTWTCLDTQRFHELNVEKSQFDLENKEKPLKSQKQHSFAVTLFHLIQKSFTFKLTLNSYTDFLHLRSLQTQPFPNLTFTFEIRTVIVKIFDLFTSFLDDNICSKLNVLNNERFELCEPNNLSNQ